MGWAFDVLCCSKLKIGLSLVREEHIVIGVSIPSLEFLRELQLISLCAWVFI